MPIWGLPRVCRDLAWFSGAGCRLQVSASRIPGSCLDHGLDHGLDPVWDLAWFTGVCNPGILLKK